MPEAPVCKPIADTLADPAFIPHRGAYAPFSLYAQWRLLVAHGRLVAAVVAGSLFVCLLCCLLAPKRYAATVRLALRTTSGSSLNAGVLDSFGAGQTQLETLASVLRGEQLIWRVIEKKQLYRAPEFRKAFSRRFAAFQPGVPDAEAENYLIEQFQKHLRVRTMPHTMILEIRFESGDPAFSAEIANGLVREYESMVADSRIQAAEMVSERLARPLQKLRERADRQEQLLVAFEARHSLLISPDARGDGGLRMGAHLSALSEIDEMQRDLATATSERIAREAQWKAAENGNPEQVLASDPHAFGENNVMVTSAFRQIHARQSDLQQQLALLSLEHGPNSPRVLEIRQELRDLASQLQAENEKLKEEFHNAWQSALDRERLLRAALDEQTSAGVRMNGAAAEYVQMRREADASRDLYLRMQDKLDEADVTAGLHTSDIWVVDTARPSNRPSAPKLPLYMALTFFLSTWLGFAAAALAEYVRPAVVQFATAVLLLIAFAAAAQGQAPTPSTSGLPTGVARIAGSTEVRSIPNAKDAPAVWDGAGGAGAVSIPHTANILAPTSIGAGDLLDVSELHLPEMRTTVRVSQSGSITLPVAGEVKVLGLDEQQAARAIAEVLVRNAVLTHPQVLVLVTASVGQDVSVLGEVAHPGVYPFTVHHRLLDLIAAASGLNPGAGMLVSVYHRKEPDTPKLIALNSDGANGNPELSPGDIVQVSRAGLVYVLGDVIRPGGFAVERVQELTVLRALSLAWGPTQNAATQKAILIREQKGGRVVTTLNLKRMLRGQDPDLPVRERDILFVPNSAARSLWSRTVESAVQSAAGVSIYAGMVYSQRF